MASDLLWLFPLALLATVVWAPGEVGANQDAKRLYDDLLSNYNR